MRLFLWFLWLGIRTSSRNIPGAIGQDAVVDSLPCVFHFYGTYTGELLCMIIIAYKTTPG